MRVYGLKSSIKSLGWLAGLIFFTLAILYPSFPGMLISLGYPGGGNTVSSWEYEFASVFASGGIVWHIVDYMRWQTFAHSPWTGRTMFIEFSPYCFVPVVLPLCLVILWRRLVTHSERPTIIRGLLVVLLAFALSLVLIFLLDQGGGRILLSILSISGVGNLEVRELIVSIWTTVLMQSALLLLPCLAVGGVLVWWQIRLEARPISRQQKPRVLDRD